MKGGGRAGGGGGGLEEVQKDVMTIFARAYQLAPSHVGVQQELGELVLDTGYEREGGNMLHRVYKQLAHTDHLLASSPSFSRSCLALARYYAESRYSFAGPGTRLPEIEARNVLKIAGLFCITVGLFCLFVGYLLTRDTS